MLEIVTKYNMYQQVALADDAFLKTSLISVGLWYSPTFNLMETPWKLESVYKVQQQSPSIFTEETSLSNARSTKLLTSPANSTDRPLNYV